MGQKVHPLGFRIGVTQTHRSNWFAKPNKYSSLLKEDLIIRNYVDKNLQEAGIARTTIDRQVDRIQVNFLTSRPRALVGENGETLRHIREELQSKLPTGKNLFVEVTKAETPDTEAICIAENIAVQLEQRVAFRRTMRQAMQRAQRAGVDGIKVQISGRLNGAEIARSEWAREGRVPLHTIRADIDYATAEALTIYGILGIKVWVCKPGPARF